MTLSPTLALQMHTLANHCPVAQLAAQHVDKHEHQSEYERCPVFGPMSLSDYAQRREAAQHPAN